LLAQTVRHAALKQNQFRITLVSRPFAYDHLSRAQPAKTLNGGGNQKGMRIDVVSGNVINQVGFQKNGFPANIQAEQVETAAQNFTQVL
jgi:hypothetical protein